MSVIFTRKEKLQPSYVQSHNHLTGTKPRINNYIKCSAKYKNNIVGNQQVFLSFFILFIYQNNTFIITATANAEVSYYKLNLITTLPTIHNVHFVDSLSEQTKMYMCRYNSLSLCLFCFYNISQCRCIRFQAHSFQNLSKW